MIDLYKLEIFNAVAMEGSFSQAARKLTLTQPAISHHMRDLEASLNTTLFERGARGVTLTPAGESLLDYTRCILQLVAEAQNAVQQVDALANGQVRLGATPDAGFYLLPQWMQSFHGRFPSLTTSLMTANSSRIVTAVAANELDIGFVEGEVSVAPPLQMAVLQPVQLLAVMGEQHAWWGETAVSIHDLANHPAVLRPPGSHTHTWIQRVLSQHNITLHVVAEFDNPESLKSAVAAGLGFTILPEWAVANGNERLQALPITGANFSRTLKLVWQEERPLTRPSQAFLIHLSDQFPTLTRFAQTNYKIDLGLPSRRAYRASHDCKAC
ncbi:MAG: LysR family transcriptional regulator [Ardenticatenaceae bacterium]|nr:LysR family transcriptional regulator [Anaerolineales bacterium]MCB8921941.1 LysR family transcriptional regulator [Ardenticatenaceae bacterium]MCB8989516.1 LysR family transcriptional regulator [Ardenticatenaceae bacterium]MCB9003060.1 LysR family transcriptional regulator [Ardenticatenaceae bacterium]